VCEMCDEIHRCLIDLLRNRQDVVSIAYRYRAKFEGWLKFEIAGALAKTRDPSSVVPEAQYVDGGNCDVFIKSGRTGYYVELKTCNTNWKVRDAEPRHRPIKMNRLGVIDDIWKLRTKCGDYHGIACFVFFPVPNNLWQHVERGLDKHLNGIESDASLAPGLLRKSGEFVPVGQYGGIAAFVIHATARNIDPSEH